MDGSEASDLAFSIARSGLIRPQKDCFNVVTITDARKDYLPFHYKPDFIEQKYSAKIRADAQAGMARFVRKEVELEKTAKQTLWMMAQLYKADVVVGMHGRKGPKQ